MENNKNEKDDHGSENEDEEQIGEQADDDPDILLMEQEDHLELLGEGEELEEMSGGQEAPPPSDDSLVKIQAHQKDVFCLEISPDGCWLASGSEDDTTAIWDLKNQSPEPILRVAGKHIDSVHCLAWNKTSNLLASADMGGRIVCIPMPTNSTTDSLLIIEDCQAQQPQQSSGQEGEEEEENSFEQIRWLQWHCTAEGILFAGCGDGSLWMWLITKQAGDGHQQQLTVHQSKIFPASSNAPCMSGQLLANARHMVAAYADGLARLWDLKETTSVEVKLPGECTGAMDVNARAGLVAIGCANGVTALLSTGSGTQTTLRLLYNFQTSTDENSKEATKNDAENSVECLRFAPGDLPWLAVGTTNGHLSIFDWERRSSRYQCEHDDEAVVSCVWRLSPDNSTISLISACIDSGIRIWDAKSGEPLLLFSGGGDEIFCLAKWEDGSRVLLFTGCAAGSIRVFQLPANF